MVEGLTITNLIALQPPAPAGCPPHTPFAGSSIESGMKIYNAVPLLTALALWPATASEAFDAFDAAPQRHRKPHLKGQQGVEHLKFQHSLVAQTAAEAEAMRSREAQVFEQGRHMRAREALYEKHLAECRGDHFCEKQVAAKQMQIEQLVATGQAPVAVMEGREEEHKAPTAEAPSTSSWLRQKMHHAVASVTAALR
ncbi:unnamed protein product [Durusdinium trenchii]|uniref:Uncharacterized protein n=2 Tax=Durusdinium trenchii TaxID=1381693 RepID=A0ABP0LY33_9DINO